MRGNCPAEIVHVSEVQKQQRFRRSGDYHWLSGMPSTLHLNSRVIA